MKCKYLRIWLLIVALSILLLPMRGQTFNRQYESFWCETQWTFDFKKNGEYQRFTSGLYGNTLATGTYRVKNDTVYILSVQNDPHHTIGSVYLLRNDSIMIDFDTYMYYCKKASYKRSKNTPIGNIAVEMWKPDSIYINHPELKSRLDMKYDEYRYCGKYEMYVLEDTAYAILVDFIKPTDTTKYNVLFADIIYHRGYTTPKVLLLTDATEDFFIAYDCNFLGGLTIGDKVMLTYTYCFTVNRVTHTGFDADPRVKFMLTAHVVKIPDK